MYNLKFTHFMFFRNRRHLWPHPIRSPTQSTCLRTGQHLKAWRLINHKHTLISRSNKLATNGSMSKAILSNISIYYLHYRRVTSFRKTTFIDFGAHHFGTRCWQHTRRAGKLPISFKSVRFPADVSHDMVRQTH